MRTVARVLFAPPAYALKDPVIMSAIKTAKNVTGIRRAGEGNPWNAAFASGVGKVVGVDMEFNIHMRTKCIVVGQFFCDQCRSVPPQAFCLIEPC